MHCDLKPNSLATKYADMRIIVPICYTLCRFCRGISNGAGPSTAIPNVNSTYIRADSLMAAMNSEIRKHNATLSRGREMYETTGQWSMRPIEDAANRFSFS